MRTPTYKSSPHPRCLNYIMDIKVHTLCYLRFPLDAYDVGHDP